MSNKKQIVQNVSPRVQNIAREYVKLETERIKSDERARMKLQWEQYKQTTLRYYLNDIYSERFIKETKEFEKKVFEE